MGIAPLFRALSMFYHKITSDTVIINAPRQWVWNILTEIAHYPNWNPFTYKISGTLQLGQSLDLYVNMPKRGNRVQTEIVKEISAPQQIAWGMTLLTPLLLSALREQTLESITPEQCSYTTSDAFRGILSGVVFRLFYDDVYNGFNRVAYALKAHAEEQWQQHQLQMKTG